MDDRERKVLEDFAATYWRCWACHASEPIWITDMEWCLPCPLVIHHIQRGPARKHDRRNLARLCDRCHRTHHGDRFKLDSGEYLPPLTTANILWLKRDVDANSYDKPYLDSLKWVLPEPEELHEWYTSQWT